MSVMSIRIDENKRKTLKVIASIEGKTMGGIVSSLIEEYLEANRDKLANIPEAESINAFSALSENSFAEWDNEEDEVYDTL